MHQTPSVSGPAGMTVGVLPPTARLPPIKTLNTAPIELLHEALQYLQTVYNPEIRTSRRINHGSAPRTSAEPICDYDAGSNDDKAVEDIRTDAFEHAYAMRWLTALVAQTTLRSDVDSDANANANADDTAQPDPLEPLVQSAAALLAVCAGAASAGTRTRAYVLRGVRVQLTDVALRNDDFGSVGAQTWGSACVLAEMIAEAPARFGLWCGGGQRRAPSSLLADGRRPCVGASAIRVLELGAGTGLVSLTIGKVLEVAAGSPSSSCCCCRAEIVASDFYSRALENLRLNIQRNFPRVARLGRDDDSRPNSDSTPPPPPTRDLSICAHFLDWEQAADPARTLEAPFDAPFDEVFGADIVYELEHAAWINACLKRVLRQTGRFHLVIPLREGFARESATVERVFPRAEDVHREIEAEPTLCITQREEITCEVWPDGKGEMEYVHYTIQWATDRGLHEYIEPTGP